MVYLLKMVIFYSYVKLPEGTVHKPLWFSSSQPVELPVIPKLAWKKEPDIWRFPKLGVAVVYTIIHYHTVWLTFLLRSVYFLKEYNKKT